MDLKSWLVLVPLVLVPPMAGTVTALDNPQIPRDPFEFRAAESTAGWSAIDDAVMEGWRHPS
jgi:hypothetical protein